MAPSPIPAPLPAWAKVLLQLLPLISVGLQEALDHIGTMTHSDEAQPDTWMHVQAVGKPIGSTDARETFVTTFDVVNITGGEIDNTWNQADLDTVKTNLDTILTFWAVQMPVTVGWNELRFYRRMFNPLSNPKPFVKSGAPEIVYPAVHVGGGGTHQAPQVALTSTEKTAYPRHWGRNYWPYPNAGGVTTTNHASSTMVNAIANAVHDSYAVLQASEFYPVVPVTSVDKVPTRGLLTVNRIQVDDVFDVIRRRRSPTTTLRVNIPPVPTATTRPVEQLEQDGQADQGQADQHPDQADSDPRGDLVTS